ncbi:MAG: PfkB family carbohydrate kinase [Maricaulaceae bacterium]
MIGADLRELVERIAKVRLLCVGDVILDAFVDGRAARVSREAPVVALKEQGRRLMLGAAGNVARNAIALGARARLIAPIGLDAEGRAFRDLAEGVAGMSVDAIDTPDRLTPCKTRYGASGQQVLCVDRDPPEGIDAHTEARIAAAVRTGIKDADVVVISDYGRGAMTPSVLRAVIEAARSAGVRVLVDPRGPDFRRYDGATLIKPNAQELAEETGLALTDDAAMHVAMRAVLETCPQVGGVLATRSAAGMALLMRDAAPAFIAARARDVYDVSGAGDTSITAFALALAAGASPTLAAEFATLASGLVVEKAGTATVTAGEMLGRTGRRSQLLSEALSLEAAVAQVRAWRAAGERIALTNGCFDILHAGHAAALEAAKGECERLVVALNTDRSVRALKGPQRPLSPLRDRAALIAALGCVDAVTAFDELDATAVIAQLQPDVYAKGADYQGRDYAEARAVAAYGGAVVFTPLMEGLSTSALVAKIREAD